LDEDNALINSSKDNKSSNMSTSGSNSEHWVIIIQLHVNNCRISLYSILFVI
jgi:hypothetical protein